MPDDPVPPSPMPPWMAARRAAPPLTIPPPPPEGLEGGYAAPTVRPATNHPVDVLGRSCGVCARLRRLFRWRA